MKKILARLMNVVVALGILFAALGSFFYIAKNVKDALWNGFGILGLVLLIALAVNYVFLGKATLWNDVKES